MRRAKDFAVYIVKDFHFDHGFGWVKSLLFKPLWFPWNSGIFIQINYPLNMVAPIPLMVSGLNIMGHTEVLISLMTGSDILFGENHLALCIRGNDPKYRTYMNLLAGCIASLAIMCSNCIFATFAYSNSHVLHNFGIFWGLKILVFGMGQAL